MFVMQKECRIRSFDAGIRNDNVVCAKFPDSGATLGVICTRQEECQKQSALKMSNKDCRKQANKCINNVLIF